MSGPLPGGPWDTLHPTGMQANSDGWVATYVDGRQQRIGAYGVKAALRRDGISPDLAPSEVHLEAATRLARAYRRLFLARTGVAT